MYLFYENIKINLRKPTLEDFLIKLTGREIKQ